MQVWSKETSWKTRQIVQAIQNLRARLRVECTKTCPLQGWKQNKNKEKTLSLNIYLVTVK